MKKLFIKVLLIISLFIIPWDAFAAGGYSVSRTSISMTKGGSASISITVTNAAGRINISSSNQAVASVSKSAEFVDAYAETRTYTFTITGNSAGNAVITVSPYDMATYDKEVITNAYQINVTVNEPAPPTPSTPSTPTTPTTPTPSVTPSTGGNTNTPPADTRSSNTNLSKLTVNGKELTNSNNTYTLEVSNYLEQINIAATAADSKATISGTGKKELKVGQNAFNIKVTAENGNTTTYTVNITRKEYNSYSDLDELLKLDKESEIRITDNDKISKEDLDKITKSKNLVILTKVSKDNKVLYSWILDGSKIKSVKEFNPNITTVVENNEKMEEALNYADGIYFDFSKCSDIPNGIILKYYVGDKYKDNNKINLYVYSSDKITQLKENIAVKDGYVEFEVTDALKHFISKAKVLNAESKEFNIWLVVSIVLICIILVILTCIIVSKIKFMKKMKFNSQDLIDNELKDTEQNDETL